MSVTSKKTIHRWKRHIELTESEVILPTGKSINHTSVTHPGAAVILPIDALGNILMINQYRPSLNQWLLELPAGTIEGDEPSLSCAKRELEEETGYSAKSWKELGSVVPLPGFCSGIQHLYLATDLEHTNRFVCDEDEVIDVQLIPTAKVEQMITDGTIWDAKTLACLFKAKLLGSL